MPNKILIKIRKGLNVDRPWLPWAAGALAVIVLLVALANVGETPIERERREAVEQTSTLRAKSAAEAKAKQSLTPEQRR